MSYFDFVIFEIPALAPCSLRTCKNHGWKSTFSRLRSIAVLLAAGHCLQYETYLRSLANYQVVKLQDTDVMPQSMMGAGAQSASRMPWIVVDHRPEGREVTVQTTGRGLCDYPKDNTVVLAHILPHRTRRDTATYVLDFERR